MQKEIFDTSLPENYSKGLFEEFNYDVNYTHTSMIADTAFSSIANILNSVKSKDHPVAFRIEKVNGTFVAAAIVQYFENNDASNPGNWSLVFTFNESDIPADAKIYSLSDPQVHSYFRAVAGEKYRFQFITSDSVIVLPSYFFAQLYKWLDENAKSGEEVCITQEGVFQARVAIEGGEKVFALEPDGEIKMLIKDDASIQK